MPGHRGIRIGKGDTVLILIEDSFQMQPTASMGVALAYDSNRSDAAPRNLRRIRGRSVCGVADGLKIENVNEIWPWDTEQDRPVARLIAI